MKKYYPSRTCLIIDILNMVELHGKSKVESKINEIFIECTTVGNLVDYICKYYFEFPKFYHIKTNDKILQQISELKHEIIF